MRVKTAWRNGASVALLLGGWGFSVLAAEEANPYAVISSRNVFHLNPPPPTQAIDAAAPAALPKIFLTGIVWTGGEAKALLSVQTDNPDVHKGPLTSYLCLGEGSKHSVGIGDKTATVELVKVYGDEEKVDIINAGTEMMLSFKENGIEKGSSPPTPNSGAVVPRPRRTPRVMANGMPLNLENPGGYAKADPRVPVTPIATPAAPADDTGNSDTNATGVETPAPQ